jgi:hypothetical protein
MVRWSARFPFTPYGFAKASRLCGRLPLYGGLCVLVGGSVADVLKFSDYCPYCLGVPAIALVITTPFLGCAAIAFGWVALDRLMHEDAMYDPEYMRLTRGRARSGILLGLGQICSLAFWYTGSIYPLVIFGVTLVLLTAK